MEEAKKHRKEWHYAESISASQECIELSNKAIFLLLQEKYPTKYELKKREFEAVLKKVSKELEYLNFPKLYLYSRFWLNFHTIAKYDLERFGVEPENLFEKD